MIIALNERELQNVLWGLEKQRDNVLRNEYAYEKAEWIHLIDTLHAKIKQAWIAELNKED